eukprot:COSAG04_NODE_3725_length_2581_cov_11.469030_2_plen_424_part_00
MWDASLTNGFAPEPSVDEVHVHLPERSPEFFRATISLLECALRAAKAHAPQGVLGREEKKELARRQEIQEQLDHHRNNLALMHAMRIIRLDSSRSKLKKHISEQNAEGVNDLLGYRVFPTLQEVMKIVNECRDEVRQHAGIQSIQGLHGEAAYWAVSDILKWVLKDADFRGALDLPELKNATALVIPREYYRQHIFRPPDQETDEDETALEELRALRLRFFGWNAWNGNGGEARVMVTHEGDESIVVVVNACRDDVINRASTWLKHSLTSFEQPGPGYYKTSSGEMVSASFTIMPVHEMVLRGMIDGGARHGRVAGQTGQTVEGISFKALEGLIESLVCNFFLHLVFNGDDDLENYRSVCKESLKDKAMVEMKPYFQRGFFANGKSLVAIVSIEQGGDGKCTRALSGSFYAAGKHPNAILSTK